MEFKIVGIRNPVIELTSNNSIIKKISVIQNPVIDNFKTTIFTLYGDTLKLPEDLNSLYKRIKVETKYGTCSVLPRKLLNNYPTIKSAIDQTDFFINMARVTHRK